MAELQEYKCPCCGGAIAFDSTLQKMKCPYCDTEYEMETLAAYDAELKNEPADNMKWKTESDNWQEGETEGLYTYVCRSCGGENVGDETTAAMSCPYSKSLSMVLICGQNFCCGQYVVKKEPPFGLMNRLAFTLTKEIRPIQRPRRGSFLL